MLSEVFQSLFVEPIPIKGLGRLGMLLPLSLSIAIVYKTIRCRRPGSIPLASLRLGFMIVFGMMLIGVILWAVFLLLV